MKKYEKYNTLIDIGRVRWEHYTSPDQEDQKHLIESYNIPLDYITGIFDPNEVAREEGISEEIEGPKLISLFYCYRTIDPEIKMEIYKTETLNIVYTQKRILTLSLHSPFFLESLFDKKLEFMRQINTSLDLVFEIIWRTIRNFHTNAKQINEATNLLHRSLINSTSTNILYRLSLLEKSIVDFKIAISENDKVLDAIDEYFTDQDDDYIDGKIRDLLVENRQVELMVKRVSEFHEVVGDTFDGILSNNLNQVMKVLTSLTIIITVPTIMAGFWGMNVKLPFENSENGFIIVLVLTVLFSVITFYWLKKKDLL